MQPIIKHQTQPCPVSCVSTCIAMIIGQPVEHVRAEYHDRYRANEIKVRQILRNYNVPVQEFSTLDDPGLTYCGVYLCTAPSLNIQAGNHQILIELTEDDYYVIDPVQGREDRLFYVKRGHVGDGDYSVELGGFTVDAFIPRWWLEQRK